MDLKAFTLRFATDEGCRAYMEAVLWPDGPVCPACGALGNAGRVSTRAGLYACRACKVQFTVTRGTAMHGSHLPLTTWFQAMFLVAEGVNARKLGERLGLPYATAWALSKRIRTMMADPTRFPLRGVVGTQLPGSGCGRGDGRRAKVLVDEALSCGDEPHENMVIEGNNLDALRWLRAQYRAKVRCILIDPPYGTGNRERVYHDRFGTAEWLAWLKARLIVARDLLADDGVMLVCIDEERFAPLDMLLGEVMPGRRIGSLVWRCRSGANDAERLLSVDHEYVLAYGNPGFRFNGVARDTSAYVDDGDPRGPWMRDNLTKAHTFRQRPNTYFPLRNPANGLWYPCSPCNVWRFASEARLDGKARGRLKKETMEEYIRQGRVLFPAEDIPIRFDSMAELIRAIDGHHVPQDRRGNPLLRRDLPDLDFWIGKPIGMGRPAFKRYLSEVREHRPLSSWIGQTDDGGCALFGDGTALLRQIMGGKVFDHPKPLSLFKGLLAQTTGPDDVVLDFFAGSGTTAHAVLALNDEDGGERRFIMVSNTEATEQQPDKNLCRDITAERIRRVIEGYRRPSRRDSTAVVEGLGGGFRYLRVRIEQ